MDASCGVLRGLPFRYFATCKAESAALLRDTRLGIPDGTGRLKTVLSAAKL
jgi:hypothetical protein